MRSENKPCCNSKSMGIHLAHNIRIRLAQLRKKKLRPDLAPLNLLFFQCLLLIEADILIDGFAYTNALVT